MDTFEKKIKEVLDEQAYIPDTVLNKAENAYEKIRKAETGRPQRKSWHFRTVRVAAAFAVALLAIGSSTLAATRHFSLLSQFDKDSEQVKEHAASLLDTAVKQQPATNQSQAEWADFRVREAICDKNEVMVEIEVTPANPDKYLLVTQEYWSELDTMHISNLAIQGETEKKISIADYAKKHGKECLFFYVGIDSKAGMQTHDFRTEADGTGIYTISFANMEKNKNMDFVCHTGVCPPKGSTDTDMIEDTFTFTLTDQTEMEQIRYLPEKETKIAGTQLVVDQVTFEKSALGMIGAVKFHYAGREKNWLDTKDADICFFLYDTEGNMLKDTGRDGGGTELGKDDITEIQKWHYDLTDLPDTLILQSKDVFTKKEYGSIKVRLAK